MNPRPCLLASVHSCIGLRLSKNDRIGLDMSDTLVVRNAWLCLADHRNLFLVRRRGWSGASRLAAVSVNANSLLVNPKKNWGCVQLLGVGNLAIVSVMDGSIL